VVVGADDDLVATVIIERGNEGVDEMSFHRMICVCLTNSYGTKWKYLKNHDDPNKKSISIFLIPF
jgi:hypothetical protein